VEEVMHEKKWGREGVTVVGKAIPGYMYQCGEWPLPQDSLHEVFQASETCALS
jgi:hypothetical protein